MANSSADPDFPPLWNARPAQDDKCVLEEAVAGAKTGELGAGDVVWSRHEPLVSVAFVLEPEHPLETALQVWTLGMVACGDMIGALAPPQVAATYEFPGQILVNGGQAGQIRCVSSSLERDAVPDWMVLGLTLLLMFDGSDQEPGMLPDQTSLAEEGCGDLTRTQIIESYSRHLLTWIYKWQEDGFAEAHREFDGRLEQTDGKTRIWVDGQPVAVQYLGLDENGSLLAKMSDAGDSRLMWLGNCLTEMAPEAVE